MMLNLAAFGQAILDIIVHFAWQFKDQPREELIRFRDSSSTARETRTVLEGRRCQEVR